MSWGMFRINTVDYWLKPQVLLHSCSRTSRATVILYSTFLPSFSAIGCITHPPLNQRNFHILSAAGNLDAGDKPGISTGTGVVIAVVGFELLLVVVDGLHFAHRYDPGVGLGV